MMNLLLRQIRDIFWLSPAYLLISLLSFLMLTLSLNARADVYGYIDDKGVAHFASERVDARYELFYRGGESFDTATDFGGKQIKGPNNGQAALSATAAVAPLPTKAQAAANSKIQAYFDISPNFKLVKHHMREAAKKHNIDFELLQALIVAESGFDALAVSPKGAVGLMQLMPATAQRFGVKSDAKKTTEQKLTDPKTNIFAGTQYLRSLILMFPGKLELAVAAYNAGEGAVQKYGNKIPPYKETENYVKTVMQTYRALKPPVTLLAMQTQNTAVPSLPSRIRMEIGASPSPVGGAVGRANMVSGTTNAL